MDKNYEIDDLDRKILSALIKDSRRPYLEIARELLVSGGTIHQRIDKMKEAGIIKGSQLTLDLKKLGHDVTVFLGIHLNESRDLANVLKQMEKLKEITEVHYTTGNYGLLIKVEAKSISHFHQFLLNHLQKIEGVRATESFISLDCPISRNITLS